MKVYVILSSKCDSSVEKIFKSRQDARDYIIATRFANNSYFTKLTQGELNKAADHYITACTVE